MKVPGAADGFRFSADGNWIAYATNDSGRYEVYAVPVRDARSRWQVSINGGVQPAWRADSREIFFVAPDGKLMSVEVKPGATLQFGTPRPLFQTNIPASYTSGNYSPSKDANRFPVVEQEALDGGDIQVVVNWDAGLKRK